MGATKHSAPDFSLYGGAESLSEGRPPRRVRAGADDKHVQPPQDPNEFLWLHTEEPHRSRRRAILAAHPEVTKLMGCEPRTKFVVAGVVALQLGCAYAASGCGWWGLLALAYVVGGTANHNLFLAIHEVTHNLAFKGIRANKALAVFANLPIGIPYCAAFKRYHIEHHKHLGEDGIDTDLPTRAELLLLNNVAGKLVFTTFQILFYALRPGFVRTQTPTLWHAVNLVVQLAFNYVLVQFCGGKALCYLLASSFFAGSLHPLAGHFLAEHYLWDGLAQETYSYYGPLNAFAYNVGYHNEHHDFPSVPWTRLPALKALAPEFYDVLPAHPSWPMVLVNFIRDDNAGIFARAKRLAAQAKADKVE